jgi:DnaJ-class molecular chaperone
VTVATVDATTERLFEPYEVTLEDSILGVWEALDTRGRAECPVCHGELETSGCKTCGSQLT